MLLRSPELTGNGSANTVIAKATPTQYGWLAEWNSTDVANGTDTLRSVVTDADGTSSTSAPITVTIDNPLASTSVIIPSTGATQSGTAALLAASASGNSYYSTSVYEPRSMVGWPIGTPKPCTMAPTRSKVWAITRAGW